MRAEVAVLFHRQERLLADREVGEVQARDGLRIFGQKVHRNCKGRTIGDSAQTEALHCPGQLRSICLQARYADRVADSPANSGQSTLCSGLIYGRG
ncbi:hypothetical protein DPEC_G00361540 [Dallia pectoralis]|nr:hypothetical protein DPEC_G00361540 [Dallia pectoralis]